MTTTKGRSAGLVALVLFVLCATATAEDSVTPEEALEFGRKIYEEGILPSGEPLTAIVANDVEITGEFVVCAECHRRSGLGASEGESIAPPVVGSLLYIDLQLPVSRPPEPPVQRPAYDYDSLAVSIRDGISTTGEEFSMLMPRYPLSDTEMGYLVAYLDSLSIGPDPGVTDTSIHFATIITDDVEPAARKALLDVMQIFIEQKNTETRYESKRATSGPWHKDWVFKPYRKWVMHTWELSGPPSGWQDQLEALLEEQPVFAVLNGLTNGSWEPVHEFCESAELPCLFPTTNLPVVDREDFYMVYLSKGITVEAEAMVQHLADDGIEPASAIQIYKPGDPLSETASAALSAVLGEAVSTVELNDFDPAAANDKVLVAWLGIDDTNTLADAIQQSGASRVYYSGSMLGGDELLLDDALKEKALLVYSTERPDNTTRLLMRSTGWFKVKRIYSKEYEAIQANAYFTLKVTGGALNAIRIFFNREFFIESIEHMIDNATYTSVYPRMSLAPEQRFVSKGSAIARFDENDPQRLIAVADWLIPAF